ncbi:MAG: AbrB/MazE/SpoVT family DNA-binding domain-containing protein [Candidatus Accumulibacter sp. UW26]|jgi:antitoxin MazE
MKVHLAKWDNSLAVRIPGECARQAQVKAGDALEIEVTSAGDRRLRSMAAQAFDKATFVKQAQALRANLSMGEPVAEAMRQADRF